MNTAAPAESDDAAIIRGLQASKAAAAGCMGESEQLLVRLAQQAPNHPAVLNELGVRVLERRAAEQAHALFARATAVDPKHPSLSANLASSLKAGRRAEEMDAIDKGLQLEPRHLSALLQKGAHQEESAGHIARCRVTARLLEENAPRPRIEARAPTAFFSILDAHTRIPPHTGVTNARCRVRADHHRHRSLRAPLRHAAGEDRVMRPRLGPWALLGTLVVLAGIAAAATAGTMNAEVTRCAAISSADERLACFDALACAAITGATERLACYDELARSRLQPGSGGTPAVGSEPAAAAPAAAAGTPPLSTATTAPAISAVATTAAATSAGGSATQSFGLVNRAPPERERGAKQIEALVQKVEVDRYGNVRVSLDNGQVWDFAEADAIVRPREAVTIRRAALGSFLLTTGSHHTYRVTRRQ